jgi:hypothetical protein
VSLIAAELERNGITTVVLQLLRVAAEKVGPPRALLVPFLHGYPLDSPDEPEKQHQVIEAALQMLERTDRQPPVLEEYLKPVTQA